VKIFIQISIMTKEKRDPHPKTFSGYSPSHFQAPSVSLDVVYPKICLEVERKTFSIRQPEQQKKLKVFFHSHPSLLVKIHEYIKVRERERESERGENLRLRERKTQF
jgi:hypothetical protein